MRVRFSLISLIKCITIVCVSLSCYQFVTWPFLIGCTFGGVVCGFFTASKHEPEFVEENIGLKCAYSALITSASAMALMLLLFIPIFYFSQLWEFTGNTIDVVFVAGIASGFLFPEARNWSHHLHSLFGLLPW